MKCLRFIDSLPHKCIILKISDFSRLVTHYRHSIYQQTILKTDTLKYQKITLE